MGRVIGLGHVGIFVNDLPRLMDFYRDVLGFTVTDGGEPGERGVFLSAQPASEHHEVVLSHGEKLTAAAEIAFPVESLEALRELRRKIEESGCDVDAVTNDGIAIACSFKDPGGNNVKLYWPTGVDYPQPFAVPIDIDQTDEEILAAIDGLPPKRSHVRHTYGKDQGRRLSAD